MHIPLYTHSSFFVFPLAPVQGHDHPRSCTVHPRRLHSSDIRSRRDHTAVTRAYSPRVCFIHMRVQLLLSPSVMSRHPASFPLATVNMILWPGRTLLQWQRSYRPVVKVTNVHKDDLKQEALRRERHEYLRRFKIRIVDAKGLRRGQSDRGGIAWASTSYLSDLQIPEVLYQSSPVALGFAHYSEVINCYASLQLDIQVSLILIFS